MPPAAAITISGATVRRGAVMALDAVDLVVDQGTTTALVGPNGSGKSTLLHLVAGLLEPTSGTVEVAARRVGYVLQHHAGERWMPLTVAEVVQMGRFEGLLGRPKSGSLLARPKSGSLLARPKSGSLLGRPEGGGSKAHDRRVVADAMERLEVAALAARQYSALSGGQRQRVLIAQALAREPQLLLLDEPLTGLDGPSQDLIVNLLGELNAQGTTIVLSTHHLEECRHASQVALLAGRLVAAGPPDQILVPSVLRQAYGLRVLETGEGGPVHIVDDHGHDHPHEH